MSVSKSIRFPHWLSAWWLLILLAVGWGPLAVDDVLQHIFPRLNANYQGSALQWHGGLRQPFSVLREHAELQRPNCYLNYRAYRCRPLRVLSPNAADKLRCKNPHQIIFDLSVKK